MLDNLKKRSEIKSVSAPHFFNVAFSAVIKILDKKIGISTQDDEGSYYPTVVLSSRRSRAKSESLLILANNMRKIACQFLMVSSLWLLQENSSKAMEKGDLPANNTETPYRDHNCHPLVHEFWKKRGLSGRLKHIIKDIDTIEQKIISSKINFLEIDKSYSERYQNILKDEDNKNEFNELLINLSSCNGNSVDFKDENGLFYVFDMKRIGGGSGGNLLILSQDNINFIAIKQFENIKEDTLDKGLKELFFSLIALNKNPSPQELKMARIYDALIYPENRLNLIMEGANKETLHNFLPKKQADGVIKAYAQYLALFHIRNHQKLDVSLRRVCVPEIIFNLATLI